MRIKMVEFFLISLDTNNQKIIYIDIKDLIKSRMVKSYQI